MSLYAGYLCSQGEVAISPITYGHVLASFVEMPTDWSFWKNFCLTMLVQCTEMHVLMLENWSISEGVEGEIEFAIEHKIPVKYIKKQINYVEQH